MKKGIRTGRLAAGAVAVSLALSGCTVSASGSDSSRTAQNTAITVISREDGSGTRSAFTELFGIQKNGRDRTIPEGEVTNSTAVVMESVHQNPNAIGYISLGSLDPLSKVLAIDGVRPSIETVENHTYPITRSFLLLEKKNSDNRLAADFEAYILSEEGQDVVEDDGYVPVKSSVDYTPSHLSGSITVGGSSSVTPVMEKLAEAYQKINPKMEVSVLQTDSSTGASSTVQGAYDLGMSSRELSEEEKGQGLQAAVIARDGIVLIVNSKNPLSSLSKEQVEQIYTGKVHSWTELEGI